MANFYLSKDYDCLMQSIVDGKAVDFTTEKDKEVLVRYFSECPAEIKMKHHNAILVYAMALFAFNDIPLFEKTCEEFHQYLMMDYSLDETSRNHLLGEFYILMSFSEYNSIKAMSDYHVKAAPLLVKPVSFIDPRSNWTFGSPSVLYMFYRESGRLSEHVADMKASIPYYSSITNGHGSGAEYIFEAEVYFNRGDFNMAEAVIQKAFYPAEKYHQIGCITCGYFLQMRLAVVHGNYNEVLRILSILHQNTTPQMDFLTSHTVNLCEGFIYAMLGQKKPIPEWILTGDFNNARLAFPSSAMLCIVYCRVLLISEEYTKLIGASDYFLEISSVFPNLLPIIYTHIYLASSYYKIYQEKEALNQLSKAFHLALPDSVYMPFVENYDFIKDLLPKLSIWQTNPDDLMAIYSLAESYQENTSRIIAEYFTLQKTLTERENQIAILAAEGLTNREIGEHLYISPNTVKTQLKNVFDKLGITSRALLSQYIKTGADL
jgi:LuxR family maltose regulon positive regulatory protein